MHPGYFPSLSIFLLIGGDITMPILGEYEIYLGIWRLCWQLGSFNSCQKQNWGDIQNYCDNLGPDYMRPVWTQTGTTSDGSPYKCFLLSTWSRSEKSSHAGFTHSGCWTDTNDSDRSEVGPRNHVNTNWFETGQSRSEITVLSMRKSVVGPFQDGG